MILDKQAHRLLNDPARLAINTRFLCDELHYLQTLFKQLNFSENQKQAINTFAKNLILSTRQAKTQKGGIDALMTQYDLSSQEGIVLMCLAEALLRIPDEETADKLIRDKLTKGNWESYLGSSKSVFVNATTWGLMLTGRIFRPEQITPNKLKNTLVKLFDKPKNFTIRTAVRQAMKLLGKQFIMGQTIENALKRAIENEKIGYRHSYDMLGEAARTDEDAKGYFQAYATAIKALTQHAQRDIFNNPGISVKLSALHPRYELLKVETVIKELYPRLLTLCEMAKSANIHLTIDAEEADRLELSLLLLEKLCQENSLKAWQGLGLAVQAYQKRATDVITFLANLAQTHQRRFMVRLVKGAYWDSEIKLAQVLGLSGYPVFSRKPYTDLSYLACAQMILQHPKAFYPQFATHNVHTLATIMEMSKTTHEDFEFQCLHGMGDVLYDQLMKDSTFKQSCRIYAPVGSHKHLLAYLVRRLLENGANSSFVNRLTDQKIPVEALLVSPLEKSEDFNFMPHPQIPQPRNLYGENRLNAKTIHITNSQELLQLTEKLKSYPSSHWLAHPLGAFANENSYGEHLDIENPATKEILGQCIQTKTSELDKAFEIAKQGFATWHKTPVHVRADCLRIMANLLEEDFEEFIHIAMLEAGKTLANAIAEVREAIDFCRYYADNSEKLFKAPKILPGPTGEDNHLLYEGRGVMVCISPWNFPLAIFLGQITAALAAGNAVLAKPAEQTPYIAFRAVQLLYQAGIPEDVLQLVPGNGEEVGAQLIAHSDVAGVIFTGSTQVAKLIQQTLANKSGPIVPLIAETGGQNAMIVDSSALPEQVVRDVILSAFDSAGQRCSALRVLYLQEDIADEIIKMLSGAMAALTVGNPSFVQTDIGPVIDQEAQQGLMKHIDHMRTASKLIYQVSLPSTSSGYFVAPTAFEIDSVKTLEKEQFGPILHIVRFKAAELNTVIEEINSTGYGLTFGIHSRIQETIDAVTSKIKAGNIYVNRNMVGAVVGVQPFGGEGLSGTGPKAGGPNYLLRLVAERAVSIDTTASGGNASLMTMSE